jgi:hypothetical protein
MKFVYVLLLSTLMNHSSAFVLLVRTRHAARLNTSPTFNAIRYCNSCKRDGVCLSTSTKSDATTTPTTNNNSMPDNVSLLEPEQPHSVWYKRYLEYNSNKIPTNYDFVLTDKELIESDPALNLLSSEIGVKEYFTKKALPEAKKEGLPISVLLERTFDTVEDVWEHLRRFPLENGWAQMSSDEEMTRKTVVVLGSGWGAHAFMKGMSVMR